MDYPVSPFCRLLERGEQPRQPKGLSEMSYNLVLREIETEILNSDIDFATLEGNYEFLARNEYQIARALANLDQALKGEQIAIDAILQALYVIQRDMRGCIIKDNPNTLECD